jgi:hypothetical protein
MGEVHINEIEEQSRGYAKIIFMAVRVLFEGLLPKVGRGRGVRWR